MVDVRLAYYSGPVSSPARLRGTYGMDDNDPMGNYGDFLAPTEQGVALGTGDPESGLIDRGLVEVVDWSGEDEPGQIAQFVVRRLDAFGIAPDTADAVRTAAAAAVDVDLDRGEHVPAILSAIDAVLEGTAVAIGELRRGDDTYVIGVMRRTDASREAWGLDGAGQELLYMIDCPCGGMNMWQLPSESPKPDEGECDFCGRALFDSSGVPIFPMTSEISR